MKIAAVVLLLVVATTFAADGELKKKIFQSLAFKVLTVDSSTRCFASNNKYVVKLILYLYRFYHRLNTMMYCML